MSSKSSSSVHFNWLIISVLKTCKPPKGGEYLLLALQFIFNYNHHTKSHAIFQGRNTERSSQRSPAGTLTIWNHTEHCDDIIESEIVSKRYLNLKMKAHVLFSKCFRLSRLMTWYKTTPLFKRRKNTVCISSSNNRNSYFYFTVFHLDRHHWQCLDHW